MPAKVAIQALKVTFYKVNIIALARFGPTPFLRLSINFLVVDLLRIADLTWVFHIFLRDFM